ncbi:MAG: hypothetical protein WC133_01725 [Candidatus Omnitrophota bacterium]
MDYLRANGVTVEYWDVVDLLFGGFEEANSIAADYVFTPRTYGQLERMLALPENRQAIYVIMIYYEGRFVRLFRLLSKYHCRTYFIAWAQFPIKRVTKCREILHGLMINPLRFGAKVINKVKGMACKKLKLVKPFDIVFAAGDAAAKMYPDAGRIVPINFVDYDHCVRTRSESRRVVKGSYAVFLDIYLPYHSDHKAVGWPSIDPHSYFFSLNRFFKILEQKYGVKIVIAAHPTADYEGETFEGREIYSGLTAELVKDADFVISHHSASLGYAVLNSKPLLFIYTDEMNRLYKKTIVSWMRDYADYLGVSICNIDRLNQGDPVTLGSINLECYNRYKYNFLTTTQSEHTCTQDIFWRELLADKHFAGGNA